MRLTTASNDLFQAQLSELDILDAPTHELSVEDIHRIRVAIKQVRARLKLLRLATGKTAEAVELAADLKSLSNALSGQRDRDVALATLNKLTEKYPGTKAQQLVSVLVEIISARQLAVPCDRKELAELVRQIHARLLPCMQVMLSREQIRDGIERSVRKMCNAGEQAMASEQCEDLHAWRKRVKTLFYQLSVSQPAAARAGKPSKMLDKLGKQLGLLHDLCFVEAMLNAIVIEDELALSLDPLWKRFARERDDLLAKVRKHFVQLCTEQQGYAALVALAEQDA